MKKRMNICILLALTLCACNNTTGKPAQTEQQPQQTATTEVSESVVNVTENVSAQPGEESGTIFHNITLQEALDKAKSESKPIFMYIYTKSCKPCRMMKKKIFPQQACADYLNSNYIVVSKDAEEGDGIEIAARYSANIYPTFLILDAEGNKTGEVIGGEGDVHKFIEKIEKASKGETPEE
jgi:thioredoxin-related protein